ncbi:hypothetical protein X798_01819 [Onchocerca flexuosa]|uniref:Uncharacterized protein n=1 Tax=Onchocerca flexuosa TaxID=387005 RepID=A0A238C0L0_9BILA|nr:hypothetical protein X798_01819 [Onchocerca flexuosa]
MDFVLTNSKSELSFTARSYTGSNLFRCRKVSDNQIKINFYKKRHPRIPRLNGLSGYLILAGVSGSIGIPAESGPKGPGGIVKNW